MPTTSGRTAGDGPDFSGWWVTPDYVGNNEFFLTCNDAEAATPSDCAIGAWRSPNVEMLQLQRKLTLGFQPDAAAGGLAARGRASTT